MTRLFSRSLMAKLVGIFLLVTLIPIAIVGYLSFTSAKNALRVSTLTALSSARDQAREQILRYLDQALSDMNYQAKTPAVQDAFRSLVAYLDYAADLPYASEHPEAPVDVKADDFKGILDNFNPMFVRFLENYASDRFYEDVLLVVDPDLGVIMYSGKKLSDFGTSLKAGELKETALSKVWQRVLKTKRAALEDFTHYKPSNSVSAFLGVPVLRHDGSVNGVLILRLGPKGISVLQSVEKMGKTSDALVVGRDLLLRSMPRHGDQGILEGSVDTMATRQAIKGESGVGETVGVKNQRVLNAWAPLGLPQRKPLGADFDWAVVAQMDAGEAFSAVDRLAIRVILIALGVGVAVSLVAIFFARRISSPIELIAQTSSRISEGDLTVDVPKLHRGDEIGELSRSFGLMVLNLRRQIKQIVEGMNVLMSSASEISTTLSQLAAGTSKTSAAVAETTTTAEQVKQAAMVSGETAKQVARTSQEAVGISESGKIATEDTIERMTVIREQMHSIAETVVRLSEHSAAVSDIIKTVQDLADQSNLLAVNASIEAARAGEHGKGFSVVALEIKNLAGQSKEATQEVKDILEDTKKKVSAVVMATERGGKAVQAGVEQSLSARESITALSASVLESSKAASVIDTSAEQQFIGVDQVVSAMNTIGQAMTQNAEATDHLQFAAQNLNELGKQLKELVERYKV